MTKNYIVRLRVRLAEARRQVERGVWAMKPDDDTGRRGGVHAERAGDRTVTHVLVSVERVEHDGPFTSFRSLGFVWMSSEHLPLSESAYVDCYCGSLALRPHVRETSSTGRLERLI